MNEQLIPVLLGADLNCYNVARAFHEAYGIVSYAFGRYAISATKYSRIVRFTGANILRDLNGKSGGNRHTYSAHQPRAGGNKANRRGSVCTQAADHGRVDILHGDGGQLRQKRRAKAVPGSRPPCGGQS